MRDGNVVVARTALGRERRMVLAGHLDTVPLADNVQSRLDGDTLWGCGTADMKSGVAVMLRAAHLVGSGELDHPTVDLWYNPKDFAAPTANTYGNSGRGILYGPGHVNLDTSLSKRFTIARRSNVEFRWDAFNMFNHPGFGFPNQHFDSPTAGRITSTIVDNRSMQFSLKLNF